MRPKPKLRCLIALTYGDGHVWGDTRLVRLETVQYMREQKMGYAVVGPDPQDEIDLATWEREQRPSRKTT